MFRNDKATAVTAHCVGIVVLRTRSGDPACQKCPDNLAIARLSGHFEEEFLRNAREQLLRGETSDDDWGPTPIIERKQNVSRVETFLFL